MLELPAKSFTGSVRDSQRIKHPVKQAERKKYPTQYPKPCSKEYGEAMYCALDEHQFAL
jgi:hypothetical protein